jgi:hypothetical protein
MNPDDNLLNDVIKIAREDTGDARVKALAVMWNITVSKDHSLSICQPSTGFTQALVEILTNADGEALLKVMGTIRNICCFTENHLNIIEANPTIFRVLLATAKANEELRVTCLESLMNLALNKEKQDCMLSPDLGLLQYLAELLVNSTGDVRFRAVSVILVLTIKVENMLRLIDPDPGLVKLLSDVVRTDTGDARSEALSALHNIAYFGWHIEQVEVEMAHLGVHVMALDMLRAAGPLRSEWDPDLAKVALPECLTILMNMASHHSPVVRNACITSGALEVLMPIVSAVENGSDSMKAIFIVTFLCADEAGGLTFASLLKSRPDAFESLLATFLSVLEIEDGKDYTFGTFGIRTIVQACVAMVVATHFAVASTIEAGAADTAQGVSVSQDSECTKIKKLCADSASTMLSYLVRVLKMFAEGAPALSRPSGAFCGGGGEDVASAELAIDAIFALLESDFSKDARKQYFAKFSQSMTDIVEIANKLDGKTTLGENAREKLSHLAKKHTRALCGPSQPGGDASSLVSLDSMTGLLPPSAPESGEKHDSPHSGRRPLIVESTSVMWWSII